MSRTSWISRSTSNSAKPGSSTCRAAGGAEAAPQYREAVVVFLTEEQLREARAMARDLYARYGSRSPDRTLVGR